MTFTLDMFEDLSGIWPSNQLDYQYRIATFESKNISWKESSHKVVNYVNYSVVGFDVTLERYTGKYFIGKPFVSASKTKNESYNMLSMKKFVSSTLVMNFFATADLQNTWVLSWVRNVTFEVKI